MTRLWSHLANCEVTPEDVLDPAELADHYQRRRELFRDGQLHIRRYTPDDDAGERMYEQSIYGGGQ